jgi:hypothetical protein
MLLILAGLLLPLGAGLAAVAWQAPSALRFAVVLAAWSPPTRRWSPPGCGGGADGIVQPWRWPAYLGWLAIRLVLLLAWLGPWDG